MFQNAQLSQVFSEVILTLVVIVFSHWWSLHSQFTKPPHEA